MPLPFFVRGVYRAPPVDMGMMMRAIAGTILLLSAMIDPAAAETPSSAAVATSAETGKAVDENRVICRSAPETGSRLRQKKLCLTAHDWRQRERDMQQDLKSRPVIERK